MGIFSFVKPGKQIFKTITSVKPSVPKTKLEKAKSKLAIAKQKTKASGARLKQTLFNIKQKTTKRENKMGGGMMGRRFGMKKGSKFPDLTGDGKVTQADILKGRGVFKMGGLAEATAKLKAKGLKKGGALRKKKSVRKKKSGKLAKRGYGKAR